MYDLIPALRGGEDLDDAPTSVLRLHCLPPVMPPSAFIVQRAALVHATLPLRHRPVQHGHVRDGDESLCCCVSAESRHLAHAWNGRPLGGRWPPMLSLKLALTRCKRQKERQSFHAGSY